MPITCVLIIFGCKFTSLTRDQAIQLLPAQIRDQYVKWCEEELADSPFEQQADPNFLAMLCEFTHENANLGNNYFQGIHLDSIYVGVQLGGRDIDGSDYSDSLDQGLSLTQLMSMLTFEKTSAYTSLQLPGLNGLVPDTWQITDGCSCH